MSLFTLFADLRGVRHELRRVADALDRAFPAAATPVEVTEADISYADDDSLAMEELREQARKFGIIEDEDVLSKGD